jgi:hypothetical protein
VLLLALLPEALKYSVIIQVISAIVIKSCMSPDSLGKTRKSRHFVVSTFRSSEGFGRKFAGKIRRYPATGFVFTILAATGITVLPQFSPVVIVTTSQLNRDLSSLDWKRYQLVWRRRMSIVLRLGGKLDGDVVSRGPL